jgi:hypothetical protein
MVKFGQLWALFPEDTHVKFMALVGSYVSIYIQLQAKIWTERNQLGDDVKNLKNQIGQIKSQLMVKKNWWR